jgi:hypothetical protein
MQGLDRPGSQWVACSTTKTVTLRQVFQISARACARNCRTIAAIPKTAIIGILWRLILLERLFCSANFAAFALSEPM